MFWQPTILIDLCGLFSVQPLHLYLDFDLQSIDAKSQYKTAKPFVIPRHKERADRM